MPLCQICRCWLSFQVFTGVVEIPFAVDSMANRNLCKTMPNQGNDMENWMD
jgi:hypothetical protein